jgi:pimeloyl-ACP methyl ester carboxylesterase
VTLTTSKHQEVYTYLRPGPEFKNAAQLGRPEPGITFRHLKYLSPPVYYIVGGRSTVSPPPVNKRKLENTRVAEMKVIEECGHLIPFEAPILTGKIERQF